jgi:hypothetical protein
MRPLISLLLVLGIHIYKIVGHSPNLSSLSAHKNPLAATRRQTAACTFYASTTVAMTNLSGNASVRRRVVYETTKRLPVGTYDQAMFSWGLRWVDAKDGE